MEFNFKTLFKGLDREEVDPFSPHQAGTSFFASGHGGSQVRARLDQMSSESELPRRQFMKSALGFSGAMLAMNEVTGMNFFDVSAAEAKEQAALDEVRASVKGKTGYVVDMHTHIVWRKDGYVEGVNTTPAGMHFVNLLDGLGKALGLKGVIA